MARRPVLRAAEIPAVNASSALVTGAWPKEFGEVLLEVIEAADGDEFFEISQDAGVPGKERLRPVRIGTPLLGEILALRRLIPDEPLEAAACGGRVDKRRHVADDIAKEVELAVVDEAADAIRVALRGEGGEDDRNGRKGRVFEDRGGDHHVEGSVMGRDGAALKSRAGRW